MFRIPVSLAAKTMGAKVVGSPKVWLGPDVVIDSRLATPGSLFVAVAGDRVDGHDFAQEAVSQGAAAILGSRVTEADVPHLIVDDAIAAISSLARSAVNASRAKVIGVTGSAGKTSTKDLIAQVLETDGETIAPIGSMNNEIGVPLTALTVTGGTKYLVIEMGSRGAGHIEWLCSITPPEIGVVTNVGTAHFGEFGSVAAIAKAKAELVSAAGEWVVLNADDPNVLAMRDLTKAKVATFSTVSKAASDLAVWAESVSLSATGCPQFILATESGRASVALQLVGRHQIANALAAAAVGLTCGLDLSAVADALAGATPRSKWRMEVTTRADGLVVINDAYNANPDSMRVALAAAVQRRQPGGRIIAVLGDMLELGELAEAAHRSLGREARDSGVDKLVAVGEYGSVLAEGFGPAQVVATNTAAGEAVSKLVQPKDVLLIKASRGLSLEAVAEAVLSLSENGERA